MTRIEITFLGTTASIPTKKRNHPAIYLKYSSKQEYCMLFDCGEGTQRQIFISGLNFMRIDNIFITHWHADHFAGLLGIMETMGLEGRQRPLHIYAPEATNFVPQILSLGYSTKSFDVVPHDVYFEGKKVTKIFETNEFEILTIPVKHRIPAVAYAFKEKDRVKIDTEKARKFGLPAKGRIYKLLKAKGVAEYKGKTIKLEDVSFVETGKKIVYSGDTQLTKNMALLAKDADVLIHDSTYFTDVDTKSHPKVEEVISLAKKAGVKKLYLTHISRRYNDEKELNDIVKNEKNVFVAKDFLKVVVQ